MLLPILSLCLISFLLGIVATNSWHKFSKKYEFNKEKCSKGGVHQWHTKQIFSENEVHYNEEYLVEECVKCGKRYKI